MASESVEVNDFSFWALRKVRVFPSGAFDSPHSSLARWVACSSTFGITVCAAPRGKFVCYRTSDLHSLIPSSSNFAEEATVPSKTVVFHDSQSAIVFLDSDCDGRFLSVTTNSPQGPFVHIFDFRLFSLECSDQPFPIRSIRLSDDTSAQVTSLEWNPAIGGMFAAACSDNHLATFQIDANQPGNYSVLGKQRLNDCVNCISWSPKGKQLVTGNASGKMSQFKPELALVRHVEAPTNITQFGQSMLKCIALCWISTTEWLIAYSPLTDNKKVNFSLLTVKKEQPPKWVHMEDITFGDMSSPIPQVVRMFPIHNWQMVLCASSCSGEIVVYGKIPGTTTWKCWSLEQGRFDVPTVVNRNPTCDIGLAMDTSCVNNVVPLVGGSTSAIAPSPLVLSLTTDGALISCWASAQNAELKSFNAAVKELTAGGALFNGQAPAGYVPPPATTAPLMSSPVSSRNAHTPLASTPSVATVSAAEDKAAAEKKAAEQAAAVKAAADKAAADKIAKEKAAAAEKAAAEKAEAEKKAAVEAERRKAAEEFKQLQSLLTQNLSMLERLKKGNDECQVYRDRFQAASDNFEPITEATQTALKDLKAFTNEASESVTEAFGNLRIVNEMCGEYKSGVDAGALSGVVKRHDELDYEDSAAMDKLNKKVFDLQRKLLDTKKLVAEFEKDSPNSRPEIRLILKLQEMRLNGEKLTPAEESDIRAKSQAAAQHSLACKKEMKHLEDQLVKYENALSKNREKSCRANGHGALFSGRVEHLGSITDRISPADLEELTETKYDREAHKQRKARIHELLTRDEDKPFVIHRCNFSSVLDQTPGNKPNGLEKPGRSVTETEKTASVAVDLENKLKLAISPKSKGVTVGTQSPSFGGLSMIDSPLKGNVSSRRFSSMNFAPKGVSTPIVPLQPNVSTHKPIVPPPQLKELNVSTPKPIAPPQLKEQITPKSTVSSEAIRTSALGSALFGPERTATAAPTTGGGISTPASGGISGLDLKELNVSTPKPSVQPQLKEKTEPAPKVESLFGDRNVSTPNVQPKLEEQVTQKSTVPSETFKTSALGSALFDPEPTTEEKTATPTTGTGISTPTSGGAGGFAKFAQQGNTGGATPAAPAASTQSPSAFSFKTTTGSTSATSTTTGSSFGSASFGSKGTGGFGKFAQQGNTTTTGFGAAPAPAAAAQSASAFSFKPAAGTASTTGSSFGSASFGSKPAFGGSTSSPSTSGGVSSPASGATGGFGKFAQQGSTSFGGAPAASAQSPSAFSFKTAAGPTATSTTTGSSFGSASFGSKATIGGATTTPSTGSGGGFSSFGSGGSGGFAKFAQQGNTGFGAGAALAAAAQTPSAFSFKPATGTASTTGPSFGSASFGSKPTFGGATTSPSTGGGFSSFGSGGNGGFAKFAQQGNAGFGGASTFGGGQAAQTGTSTFGGGSSTFGGSAMTPAGSSTFGGGSSFSGGNQGASFTSWR